MQLRESVIIELLQKYGITRTGLSELLGYGRATNPMLNWERSNSPSFRSKLVIFLRLNQVEVTPCLQKVFPELYGVGPAVLGIFQLAPLAIQEDDNVLPNNECIVCMESLSGDYRFSFIPCGHARVCHECLCKMQEKRCPECRATIEKLFKIYL
jgi:hypothetical protein